MASQQEEEAEELYPCDSIPARRSQQVGSHGQPVDSTVAGDYSCFPARRSVHFGGFNLSSQASFMDLLHSTPEDVYGEEQQEFAAGAARGDGRGTDGAGRGAGASHRIDRGGRAGVGRDGRGGGDRGGRSGGGDRGGRGSGDRGGRGGRRGRGPVLGSEEAAVGRGAGRGRGVDRSGQIGLPPIPPSSLPYRAPRPSSSSIEIDGVPDAEHEPEDSNFNDQYYDGVGDDESGHAAWRKLKYGPPETLSELEIMFEHTVVDGSTSCVPGEHMDDEGDVAEEGGEEDADGSPLSVSNNKRSSNSTARVNSPKKRIKSPMVRIMKGMYEEMKETNAAAQKAMQEKVVQAEKALQEKKDSITKCMSLAVESGAFEGSAEHFMAGTLFVKEEHRQVFLTITTSPVRLPFLKRLCRAKNVE